MTPKYRQVKSYPITNIYLPSTVTSGCEITTPTTWGQVLQMFATSQICEARPLTLLKWQEFINVLINGVYRGALRESHDLSSCFQQLLRSQYMFGTALSCEIGHI